MLMSSFFPALARGESPSQKLAQLAKHRLETNEVQISEYLQAEMDFTEERGLLYKALSDFFLAKAKLNRAIGIRDYLMVEVLK